MNSAEQHLKESLNNSKRLTLQSALTSFATFRNILHGNNIRHMFLSGSHPPIATGCLLAFVPEGLVFVERFPVKEENASNPHSLSNWMVDKYLNNSSWCEL